MEEKLKHLLRSAALVFLMIPGLASAQEVADTIYSGGPILTINDSAPDAEAVVVISSVTKQGLKELNECLWQVLSRFDEEQGL